MTSQRKNLDRQSGISLNDLQLEAKEFFEGYYNCAQATFLPFALRFGLSKDIAAKIALPFGGGMSQSGQVCGAVTGGLLAIGLAMGTSGDDPQKKSLVIRWQGNLFLDLKPFMAKLAAQGCLDRISMNRAVKCAVRNRVLSRRHARNLLKMRLRLSINCFRLKSRSKS